MPYLSELVANAKAAIESAQDAAALDLVRIKYLGKKGYFAIQMQSLHNISLKHRPVIGAMLNEAKQTVQDALSARKNILETAVINKRLVTENIDISLPGRRMKNGGLHPVTLTIDRVITFFTDLGFSIVTGPEIEDYYHNFDALNIPAYHPARADHDTFWFDATRLLRTHTSSVQIRAMKNQLPPIRIIAPGRVYRNDHDKTHTPMFHQIEVLIVDKDINFSNLKGTLHNFLNNFFEKDIQIRFRPSYFPFTEPSAEVDVIGKDGKWLEVLGCGMVHPKVLCNAGIDPEVYSSFAFGMGIERFTMLRYDVKDLREFFENDLRFLSQFK
ncbi:phenylalanyl-tRNA synthetase, a subunit [Serratia symbiotica str. 'Cinara cedri']|nr:phenylalanyl-tRNA synthetase, a subunit [Serratia symbiotica str. 'Cinara cedri']